MRLLGLIYHLSFIFGKSEATEPLDGILTKDQISEDRQNHLQNQIKKFREKNENFKNLPVHSRTKRASNSCPGAQEEEILYK